MRTRVAVGAVALALVAAACRSGGAASPSTGTSPSATAGRTATASPSATATTAVPLADVHVRVVRIAALAQPIAMAVRAGDGALYVAQKDGRVVAIRDGRIEPTLVLDLRGQVSAGGEQGLLGIAFSPDGRYLDASYTDLQGNSNVVEFAMGPNGRAAVSSRREVLFVQQPYSNHNGGDIAYGPDGDLYVGLGDGGSEGDPLHTGQDLGVLLGKLLRIEPRMPDGALPPNGRYAIPDDNPFVGRAGARPEIWAYGLRNPWRFSFDRATGDLWIGDVGQNTWEEVDLQRAPSHGGENFGWSLTEGSHTYAGHAPPANWARPLFDYSHDTGGCAVTGGSVYRGTAIPGMSGAYLYSDYCLGELLAVRQRGGDVTDRADLHIHVDAVASFGQDANGELYVLSLSGAVDRIVPAG